MKRLALALGVTLLFALALNPFALAQSADPHAIRNVVGKNGMVAAAHPLASQAGVDMIKQGGNAIDAAVAAALTLNAVEPNASGLGGGGFMVIRFAKTGEVVVLDYREKAPLASTRDMYASDKAKAEKWTQLGGMAVGVPGTPKGLEMALKRFGTKTFAEVAAPAIKYAEEGFEVSPMLSGLIKENYKKMADYNELDRVPYFLDGMAMEPGDILKNPELARTLRLIAEKGTDVFYKGEIGEKVVAAVQKAGGIMTMEDLAAYSAEFRQPVHGNYRGYDIISMPPPSSGGTHLIQILNMMENFNIKALGHNTPTYIHVVSDIFRMAFADRAAFMADSDFVKVPLDGLTNKEYAKGLAANIDFNKAMTAFKAGEPQKYEHESTTHLTVVDAEGNIVALTQTINYFFGSGVMATGTGLMLNNEMDDFSTNPTSVSAPEPGKRPLSSMTPTIVLKDGKPFLALGTPGATRIFPSLVQIIANIIDFGMNLDEAIEAPRFWASSSAGKPGNLVIESRIPQATRNALLAYGHKIDIKGEYDAYFGACQAVLFDAATGDIIGAADSRRLGEAIGF